MAAMHQSDSSVKEHLIERVNELEKVNMEQSTELLFSRQGVQALIDDKASSEEKANQAIKELSVYKETAKQKLKLLKE